MNHEPLLCGTATCNNNELEILVCESNNCPLKLHRDQDIPRDGAYLANNCHNSVNGCFCQREGYVFDDRIARCNLCRKDYHICPVHGCGRHIAPSRPGFSGPGEGFRDFRRHLRTHNGLPAREAAQGQEPPAGIIAQPNNNQGWVVPPFHQVDLQPDAVENIFTNELFLEFGAAVQANAGNAFSPVAVINQIHNQNQLAGDPRFNPWRGELQEILDGLRQNNGDDSSLLRIFTKLRRKITRGTTDPGIIQEFDRLEEIWVEEENRSAAIQFIEGMIGRANPEVITTMQVTVTHPPPSPQPGPSQAQMVSAASADGICQHYRTGSLIFYLYYKTSHLYNLLKNSGEGFLPEKLPVQFKTLSGDNYTVQLQVESWKFIIPINPTLEQKLIDEGVISKEKSVVDEKSKIRWYQANSEEEEEEDDDTIAEEVEIREMSAQQANKEKGEGLTPSPEEEFYQRLADEFDIVFVKKLRNRVFQNRKINWFVLHRCATELSYKPKTGLSKQSNKFSKVVQRYLDKTTNTGSKDDQIFRQNALRRGCDLKTVYDNSGLATFLFNHNIETQLQRNQSTTSSISSAEMELDDSIKVAPPTDITEVENLLEDIQKSAVGKSVDAKEIFNLIKRIYGIVNNNKPENLPLPDTKNILFFGRNGNGKSTLINMILFSTTVKVDNIFYQKNNSFFNFREFEAIRYISSLISPNDIETVKRVLGEKWSDIVEKINDQSYEAALFLSKSRVSSYELVDFTDLVTKKGKWKEIEEYENELQNLGKLSSGDDITMLGVIKPFILKSPGRGNQGSCTAHLTRVRYGNRWQAVVELLPLKEILARFDEGDGVGDMKNNLWEKLNSLLSDCNTNVHSQSNIIENHIPTSSKEAEANLPKPIFEHFKIRQGFVILSTGNDIHLDRMIVRSKMFEIVEKYGPFIKDVTVFAPSPLLNQYPLSLIDAPGDDDVDWAKGKQLGRACTIADAVVVVSKRDFSAGISLNSFAKYFGPSIFKGKHSLPIFVVLREDSEDKSTVENLSQLAPNRKEKEKSKTVQLVRDAFTDFSKKFGETPNQKKEFEQKAKLLEIDGGCFFYTWCAMRAFGNSIKNDKEREILLEESGYNDLQRFLSDGVIDLQKEDSSSRWKSVLLDMIKDAKKHVTVKSNKMIQEFIQNQLKGDDDDKIYYDFKEELFKHPFFWDSTGKGSIDKSNGIQSQLARKIQERCKSYGASISVTIKDKLRADLKEEFVSRVDGKWKANNLNQMLSINLPDTIAEGEARIFPEFIAPLLNADDFIKFVDFFQNDVMEEYMACANKAIIRHVFKNHVKSMIWKEGRTTRSSSKNSISYENLLEEMLKYDENTKLVFEFIKNTQASDKYKEEFKRKIDGVLKRFKKDFLKGREIFSNVKLEIKNHLFNHLKKKITGDIDSSYILEETIQAFNEREVSEALILAVEKTFKEVLKVMFSNFVLRTRLPIIRTLVADFLKDPAPSIPEHKMKSIEENLSEIEKICGKQVSEKSQVTSNTHISLIN